VRFFENSISQEKSVGLRLSSVVMNCKNVLDEIHELLIGFILKTWILWKMVKWYEFCKTLKLKWIDLWDVDVYTIALICDLCIYLIEAAQRVCFVFTDNLKMKGM